MLYFDHNATTPVAPEVAAVFLRAQELAWGNPSSVHGQGQAAREALESARRSVARALNATPAEIVFTSGGTESNNLAILGLVRSLSLRRPVHVVTSAIEHPAVLGPCRELESLGVVVTYVAVDRDGVVDPDEVRASLKPDTVLVSVMHANNEVGTLQPIREIAQITRERGVLMHSDGVQAVGKLPVDLAELGVDLYSISAHKLHAPKGTGVLFVKKGTPLLPLQFGGRQERERRPGTENVPGAAAFAKALDAATGISANLRDRFETVLSAELDDVEIFGSGAPRLPNTSNVAFQDVRAEAMVIALDMNGMAVSTGSACSSGSIEPSHVLLAMGRSRAEAGTSVRFSFGRDNTPEDVDQLAGTVIAIARKLRQARRKSAPRAEVCSA